MPVLETPINGEVFLAYLNAVASGLSKSGAGETFLQLVWAVLMFVVVLVAAYFCTRWLGKAKMPGVGANLNLRVVESRSVGVNAAVHIVKAGGKYVLIGVTKERVNFLAELDGSDIVVPETPAAIPFAGMLAKFMKKDASSGEAGDSDEKM